MDHPRTLNMVRWVRMIQEEQTVRKDISCTSLWVGGELSDQPLIHWGKNGRTLLYPEQRKSCRKTV